MNIAHQKKSLHFFALAVGVALAVLVFVHVRAENAPIRVMFLGDVMLDRDVEKNIKRNGFEGMFNTFRSGLAGHDLVVANLEGPFAPERLNTLPLSFRFDPALAPELHWLGLDAVSLANNHTLNMGLENLAYTRRVLGENDVKYFGDPWSVSGWSSYTTEIRGKKIALVGFNTTFGSEKTPEMIAKVKEARADADYLLVMMHWGNEYQAVHSASQEAVAHALIDAGADAIIGAHPHVIQDTEVYQNKPIAYSLGNFIFDQYFSLKTQKGMAAELVLQGDEVKLETRTFTAHNSVPTWD